jgi:hypothetical protein
VDAKVREVARRLAWVCSRVGGRRSASGTYLVLVHASRWGRSGDWASLEAVGVDQWDHSEGLALPDKDPEVPLRARVAGHV